MDIGNIERTEELVIIMMAYELYKVNSGYPELNPFQLMEEEEIRIGNKQMTVYYYNSLECVCELFSFESGDLYNMIDDLELKDADVIQLTTLSDYCLSANLTLNID